MEEWQVSVDASLEKLVHSPTFIDKTKGIKCIFQKVMKQTEKCLILTVPSGFGKSTNLKFLKAFLEPPINQGGSKFDRNLTKTYSFFADNELDIFNETSFFKTYFAQYPVIYIDLKNIHKVSDNNDVFLQHLIRDILKQHSYLPEIKPHFYPHPRRAKDFNLSHINALVENLFEYYQKRVFAIFDINEPVYNKSPQSVQSDANEFNQTPSYENNFDITTLLVPSMPIHGILQSLLLEDDYIAKIIITRSVSGERFDQPHFEKMIKYLNIFESKSLSRYYGFVPEEVSSLAEKLEIDIKLEDMKNYYGGYLVEGCEEPIFSMHSVLEFFKSGVFQPYFRESPLPVFVLKRFKNIDFGDELQDALTYQISSRYAHFYTAANTPGQGSAQEIMNELNNHTALQYLADLGYLTQNFELYNDREAHAEKSKHSIFVALTVPNAEMKQLVEKLLYVNEYYENKYKLTYEVEKKYIEALIGLDSTEETYQMLIDAVASFFQNEKPRNTAELIGPLFNSAALSGKFFGYKRDFSLKNGEKLFIKRNDGVGIILHATCDEESAANALKTILRSDNDFFDELSPIADKIFIGLHYSNESGCSLSYLYNSSEIAHVKAVVSSKTVIERE